MATIAKAPPITVEQFLDFQAPPGFRDELIEGKIVLSPDPKPLHVETARRVERLLEAALIGLPYVVRQRVNWQMDEHSMPSPDVFVVAEDYWRQTVEQNKYPVGSPVVAVEVLSRSNTRKEILRKTGPYLRHGTACVWIVYPKHKKVEAIRKAGSEICLPGDLLSLQPFLPHLTVEVRRIFES